MRATWNQEQADRRADMIARLREKVETATDPEVAEFWQELLDEAESKT